MQSLEYNHEDFQRGRQSEADKSLLVKFFYKPRPDPVASEKEGRPIFKDVLYISIDVPGNRLGGACRPADQRDLARFPEHYAAFKNRTNVEGVVGTLLSEWPKISRSQAEELSFLKIKTVEQLAEVSDGNGAQIMNFHALRNAARDWLNVAKSAKSTEQLHAELAKRDAVIAELTNRLDALTSGGTITPITAAPCAPKKKGGRPRKIRPDEAPTTQ